MSSPLKRLQHALAPGHRRPASLAPYHERILAIRARQAKLETLDEAQFGATVSDFRQRLAPPSLDSRDVVIETFAWVCEASRRHLGMEPYDVQLAAGLALDEGKMVEMQTGEGKTLAAVAPCVRAALDRRGVHVLTFNDYLARRDAEWMGPVYRALGLSVGFVQEGMHADDRQRAYRCDVTYLTAKEAGFDLLRDHLELAADRQVHRPLHFALVDEADSILVDEARIPLVIAGTFEDNTDTVRRLAVVAKALRPEIDFDTDDHARNIALTTAGARHAEELLDCRNLFAVENTLLLAEIRNALHAEHLLVRDVDYIVRHGKVELVDEFTGRVALNRHWPDGLQLAVEAKESLPLQDEGKILASITLQHLLRSYPRLAGMTATATSAAHELEEFYGLDLVALPTHRPSRRIDEPDVLFSHKEAKKVAVVDEVAAAHQHRRPVLVGTASVEESEDLAARLLDRGVPVRVLNAKNDSLEADIIADAGAPGAVTISTNMAGRGTDIRLGGRQEVAHDEVVALGGLYVIGTNRHESRRIDDQLRGRAGRQGDPGTSRFFLSLEDDLLERYHIDRLIPQNLLPQRQDDPLSHSILRREVDRAQRIIEGENFAIRRRLLDYSELVDQQRQCIYKWRQDVLMGDYAFGLLEEAASERCQALRALAGNEIVREIEQRLTLHAIDEAWSDYLLEVKALREEIHLVRVGGQNPLSEFYRRADALFTELLERIDQSVISLFDNVVVDENGVDWQATGLRGPSATWTYLVNDSIYRSGLLLDLANRASIGFISVAILWPLLFAWGLYLHWRKRSTKRSRADELP